MDFDLRRRMEHKDELVVKMNCPDFETHFVVHPNGNVIIEHYKNGEGGLFSIIPAKEFLPKINIIKEYLKNCCDKPHI